MVTSRHQPRRFAAPRKALQLLRGIGLTDCRIDTAQWRPENSALEKTPRPDRSLALRAAHEAVQRDADCDRWFHAKVQASMDGLKDGTNKILTDEEMQARRTALIARVNNLQGKRAA